MFRSSIESFVIHAVLILLLFAGTSSIGTGDGKNEGTLQISTHIVEEHDPGEGNAPEKIQEEVVEQPPEPIKEEIVKEEVVEKEPEIVEPIEEVTEIEDNVTEVEEVAEVEQTDNVTDSASDVEPSQVAGVESPTAVVGGGGADGGEGSSAAVSSGGSSGIFSLVDVDLVPKLLNRKKPEYPSYAKENRIEGVVRLGFIVDTKGRVQNPVIIKATPANVFEKTALATVSKWTFTPAKKAGKKVSVKMAITLRFNLEDIE